MRPIVDAVRERYQDRVTFVYLDATGNGRAAFEQYGLLGHPSYVLLRPGGSVAWRFLGYRTEEQFSAEIERVLAGN